MPNRAFRILLLVTLLLPGISLAQSFDQTQIRLFRTLHRMPDALARYDYLRKVAPELSEHDRVVAFQLMASAQCELGLYNQAILSFPLEVRPPANLVLPDPTRWRTADAVDVISRLAADRRIVMVNEAHHNAHTRVLVLKLLPHLRALGFDHFAAEALVHTDPGLQKRGYPTYASGTEYLQEPLYGDIVREAIRLGFTIVPYDEEGNVSTQARDSAQADNLYREVFVRDPDARLFVLAGYAHIDKGKGRLGSVVPMAARLQTLTGSVPLSIDQTQFLETGKSPSDDYRTLVARFHPGTASVLLERTSGKPWSARPELYDVNVILPPAVSVQSFGDKLMIDGEAVKDISDPSHFVIGSLNSLNRMLRPAWLTLGGMRQRFSIDTSLCRTHIPCVVDAQYANEPDIAIAADRYAFMNANAITYLFLRPGRYRLLARDTDGKTLSQQMITVTVPRTGKPPTP